MTRYVCTVAVGVLLALAGSGTAAAGLPLVGDTQQATQTIGFGDQTIGEQKNDADVTQAQGNGNVNVSPAVSVFGDASTSNSQGNDNVAVADVNQSNTATQTQSAQQQQAPGDAEPVGEPAADPVPAGRLLRHPARLHELGRLQAEGKPLLRRSRRATAAVAARTGPRTEGPRPGTHRATATSPLRGSTRATPRRSRSRLRRARRSCRTAARR